jgi:hypothetical protein
MDNWQKTAGDASNTAYARAYEDAMDAGYEHDEAHELGLTAADEAYDNFGLHEVEDDE